MLEKILGCWCYILLFSIFHGICRASSSYFPKNKCQKYIIIKNDLLSIILISERISSNKIVGYHDLDKMSRIGLISYIIIEPINIYVLIINFMDLFKLGNVHFGSIYHVIPFCSLGILAFAFIIAILIDKYSW